MIVVGADWAPYFVPAFVGLMLAVMAWIVIGTLRRRSAPEPAPPPLAPWRTAHLGELAFDGLRVVTSGTFRRASRHTMVSARALRGGSDRALRPLARLSVEARAFGPMVRGGTVLLQTGGPSIALAIEPYLELPWTLAPQMARVAVRASGTALGVFEVTDTVVVARDTAGRAVAEWSTGVRPGSWLRSDAAIHGRDVPTYAPLRFTDGRLAELRLPRVRMVGRRYDFSGVAFLKPPPDEPDEPTALWLLAFIALSARVSAGLLARERSRPARPPPESRR